MPTTLIASLGACALVAASPGPSTVLPTMIGLAALWAVFEFGYYGVYVWFVGRLRAVLSRAGVRRRVEQVSGGVLLLLGVRMALES